MRQVARSLREAAADLRVIGQGAGLQGKYADRLREGATDLEEHLRQVAERYERVHGHLTSWSRELEDFQQESVRLLRHAQAAEDHARAARRRAAHPAATTGQNATAAQPADDDDPVQPYRRSLHRLTDHRDQRAAHYAKRIEDACDDIVTDSRWERFSEGAGDLLGNRWFNDTANLLGIVASAVGVLALFCTPAGWIITACAAVGFAMAAKDALAAATGNGSWLDVGLDAVGFLGAFSLGRALRSLKAIRAATKLASESAAAEEAGSRVLRNAESTLREAHHTANSRTASRAARARARHTRGVVREWAEAAGATARAAEHARALPEPSRGERALAGGEREAAAQFKDIKAIRARYPHHSAVRQASRHAGVAMGAIRGVAGANTVIDWGGKAGGAWSPRYAHLEDSYTVALGSRW